MKTIVTFILLSIASITVLSGQIKIGDNPQNIDPSSVLELESNTHVLVITRVNTADMEAIIPQRGGLVFNTDTSCIHYYDGTQWINLCDATSFTLTNDAIESPVSTISITETAEGYNLEVTPNSIRTENIVDGTINGDDIQANSIGEDKLGRDSVSSDELRDNSVGTSEIEDGSITPTDIGNTSPNQVLTTDENGVVQWENGSNLMGAEADQTTITGTGTTLDPLVLAATVQATINDNTADITDHIIDDLDTDDRNELTDLTFDPATNILSLTRSETAVGQEVDLSGLNNAGTDDQELTLEAGNLLTLQNGGAPIDLNPFLDNTDNQTITDFSFNPANNTITLTLQNGGSQTVNLTALSGTGTDNQTLSLISNILAITGGNNVNLNPYLDNTDEQQLSINPAGTRISLTDGGFVDLPPGTVDTDEQQLSINPAGTRISLTNGGFVDLPPGTVDTDEQQLSINPAGTRISLTNGGFVDLPPGTVDTDNQNAAEVPVVLAPVNYTSTTADVEAHLTGIDIALASVGSTEEADGTTITGVGTNADPFKIEPGTDGQFLSTTAGAVIWANLPTGTGGTVQADGVTIEGNGSATNQLQIVTGGITTTQIFDGTIGTLDIADNNITPEKIQEGADGQVLTTNGIGDVIWATPGTPTIVSADTPNSIMAGTDGGARYDDTPLVNATTANATATAANTTALAGKEDTANKSTDGTLADNSDTDFPTEQAVKTYVDNQISGV
ncbi:hypothetical protein, partial [Maribacter sp. 2304DJ31-5]|uniref:hypothetical protein n=1 Tax=Maribacter sp. 2304DJ31-5 TaxID=3386273 RepID=UPI0039BC8F25